MNQKEMKEICAATMLRHDAEVLSSLAVIGDMMDEVVKSDLCILSEAPVPAGESVLRADEVVSSFTREEMLRGVKMRKGEYVVVPTVIK